MKNKENVKKFNFWPYFAKYKFPIGIYIFIMLIQIVIELVFSIFIAGIIETVANGDYYLAIQKFMIVLCINVFANTISYTQDMIGFRVSNKVVNAMRVDIACQAFRVSDKSYTDHSTSNFTQRIASDPSTIYNKLDMLIWNIRSILSIALMMIYIFTISPLVGIVGIAGVGLVVVLERVRKNKFKKNMKVSHAKSEKANALLNEVIRSQKDIKSLNLENKLRNSIIELTDDSAKQDVKTSTTNRTFRYLTNVLIHTVSCVMMITSLYIMNKGLLTLSAFMIIYNNRYQIRNLATVLSDVFGFAADIELSVSRISELFEDDEYEIDKFGKKNLKNVQGEIEFKNVAFGYIEYKDKTPDEIKAEKKQNKKNKIKARVKTRVAVGKNQVFKNISFKIEPNTSVAFVGKSGSGKTTILNLISKMYNADKGKILIDNVDVKKLSKDTLRNSISLVNQFPYIFDMTIKENMLLAKPDATNEEIETAVKEAALDDFIQTLPNGIDTKVGESGIKLSGGQKQRVAIARAMLRKSSIIIFDESTSSLDNIAQAQIKKSIDNIKGKSTVVIVAHRLSTIKNVDKIFFLEEGEIVDSGTFQELYKRNKSFKQIFLAENI